MTDDPLFWAKTETQPDGCIVWTGSLRTTGYGQVRRNRKNWAAHRWAYQITYGPIPDGLHIDHLCGVITCVNPDHLEAVTQQENNARTANDTYCRNSHLREGNTYIRPDGRRECYMCNRARDRVRYNTVNPRKP